MRLTTMSRGVCHERRALVFFSGRNPSFDRQRSRGLNLFCTWQIGNGGSGELRYLDINVNSVALCLWATEPFNKMYIKGSCKTLTGVDTSRLELTCHSLMILPVEFKPNILSCELSNPYRPIHDNSAFFPFRAWPMLSVPYGYGFNVSIPTSVG